MSEQKIVYTNSAKFDLKRSSNNELKQMLGSISSLVKDATFIIDENGLTFRGMDPSHVALIDVNMSSNSFEKFEVKEPGLFSVRIDELHKIIKTLDKKDSISLSVNDDLLNISTRQSKTQLRTIEHMAVDTPLPKLNYNSIVGISFNDFKRSLKQIEAVSEYVVFEATHNIFKLSGHGDSGSNEITFERGMPELPELNVNEDSKSTYSLEYMLELFKHLQLGTIELMFSSKQPLKLKARLDNSSTIEYYLAPRVEN